MDFRYDLAIIGGGINGAGIARDAAMRGLRVILLEKSDFACGASGQNGRMIHGGLRYLETFDFGLVHESLYERRVLLNIAPHLVREVDLTIPIRKGGRSRRLIALGLFLFDCLDLFRGGRSRIISAADALATCDGLLADGLVGAAVIHDAWAEYSERLTIENLLAAREHSAQILNRARVLGLEPAEAGRSIKLTFGREDGGVASLFAAVVVNATGAWADEFLTATGGPHQPLLRASKGTILVADGLQNAPDRSVFFEAAADGRPVLIAPWNGMYLIGTTDVVADGPIDDVRAEAAEIDYLLTETNRSFPNLNLGRHNIRYSYTGVRPLPFSLNKSSVKVSRQHVIRAHPEFSGRLVTVIGGKLSTFRRIAEDVLRSVSDKFDQQLAPSRTALQPLPGAQDAAAESRLRDRAAALGLSAGSVAHLVAVFGARAHGILDLMEGSPLLAAIVDPETGATAAEIHFVVQTEWARDLTDILVRRTMIGRNRFAGRNAVDAVCEVLKSLGWGDKMIARGKESHSAYVKRSTDLVSNQLQDVCHDTT